MLPYLVTLISMLTQLLSADTSLLAMCVLTNPPSPSLLCPKLSGHSNQLLPNISGNPLTADTTDPSCLKILHGCCVLLVPQRRSESSLFPSSPFPPGTRKSHLYLRPSNYSQHSLLTNQEPIKELDLSIRTSPYIVIAPITQNCTENMVE